jgi:aspartokinase
MKKISDAVAEIMEKDYLIRGIAQKGLLNHRAYAKQILPLVEKACFKEVKLGSVTTAVTRYADQLKPIPIPPNEDILRISVQKHLSGLTYERTIETSEKIRNFYREFADSPDSYITVTQGVNEITIIANDSIIKKIKTELTGYNTIYDITNIAGISVKFDIKYMEISNLFYALIRKLALRNINIIEIVSTATELTFIIDMDDVQASLEGLHSVR